MPEVTLESILADVRGEQSADPFASASSRKFNIPTKFDTSGVVQDVKKNVHQDAIYDRSSDGTYIPKFENYKGGVGNENRLANEQGVLEQTWNGLAKNLTKVGVYALDATVGTVYGITQAIDQGKMEGLFDNDFSNTMDDWNKHLDYAMPNYYSDEQKSASVLGSMATVNFWANDVAGGLAFVGGALLPEIALGFATGGASAPTSFAKVGLKFGAKKLLKKGAKELAGEALEAGAKKGIKELAETGASAAVQQTGLNLIRASRFAKAGEYTGEVLKTAGFLVRTSNFEAGMEARHNLHQSTDEYLSTFKELNGREPTFDEYSEFLDGAVNSANWVYGANMAILSVSNMAMFGAKFNVGIRFGKGITNAGNRAIGLGVTKKVGEKAVMSGANKLQRVLGNTYKVLGSAAVEGLYEEGLQGVAGTTMQNYLKAKYDPEVEEGYGLWSSLTDAFGEQYTTKDGWKEMAIGMIIGYGAPVLQGQGFSGFGKNSRKSKQRELQGELDVANGGVEILRNIDRTTSMAGFRDLTNKEGGMSTEIANSVINMNFIKTQEHLKTAGRITQEFEAVVDGMTFNESQIEDLGGVEASEVYKENLKEEFRQDAKNYRAAKSMINSIGLSGKIKTTKGNTQAIGEALVTNMMVGNSALRKAQVIGKRLDELTAIDGTYSALSFYSNLSTRQKEDVQSLKKDKRRLRELKKLAIEYGQRSEGVEMQNRRALNPETIRNNYNKFSEKVVLTQQEITNLENKIRTATEALDTGFRASGVDVEGMMSEDGTSVRAEEMIETIDQFEAYKESLRKVGKNLDADALDHLTTEFKMYADAHRQMNSDVRRMFDTNFFNQKEGKGLVNFLLGTEYKMSDEFRNLLKENDELLDSAFRKAGLKYDNVEQALEEAFDKNEELSDREKFRLESIVRVALGAERIKSRLEDIQDNTEIVSSVKDTARNPLEGDTISLKRMINPEGKDLSNLDVLNEVIDSIVEEIDAIRNLKGEKEQIKVLKEQLATLKETEVEAELEKGDYTKVKLNMLKTAVDLTEEEDALMKTYAGFVRKQRGIATLNTKIKDLKAKTDVKIAATEEYKKLKDLAEKKRNKTISPEELTELTEVTADIDDWILITGTVVEGLRLSDLIRQKLALEDTEIFEVEEVEVTTSQDKIDQIDISDKKGGVSYSYGQTYVGVTAININEGIEISGVKPAVFETLVGKVPYTLNEQGNIIISPEVQAQINEQGVLSILPTNKDLTSNYSVVLHTQQGFDGTPETNFLKSTFNEDFNGEMNADAIYDQEIGAPLVLEVNPNDAYNVELLEAYRKATGSSQSEVITDEDLKAALEEDTIYGDLQYDLEGLIADEKAAYTAKKSAITRKRIKKETAIKDRAQKVLNKLTKAANKGKTGGTKKGAEEALDNLRKGLVIRVKDSEGNFMSVLKGKRNKVESPEAEQFEALRDQVASDTDFLMRMINTGISEEIRNVGEVSSKKILIGHPNFNFVKTEDGGMSIESREITEQDVKNITDIGFVQHGQLNTKSKEKGINTTFISRSIKNAGGAKVPFVVMTKGKTKFAYPVTAIPKAKEDISEFNEIFQSGLSKPDKAIALNTFMAGKGIDIKEPGNSFIGLHKDNINTKFFAEKLAQLEAINYFSDLKSWSDPKVAIGQNIAGQVMIDVKLNDPLHSPKLQMDFGGITAKSSAVKPNAKKKKKADKNTMSGGSGAEFLKGLKDC